MSADLRNWRLGANDTEKTPPLAWTICCLGRSARYSFPSVSHLLVSAPREQSWSWRWSWGPQSDPSACNATPGACESPWRLPQDSAERDRGLLLEAMLTLGHSLRWAFYKDCCGQQISVVKDCCRTLFSRKWPLNYTTSFLKLCSYCLLMLLVEVVMDLLYHGNV